METVRRLSVLLGEQVAEGLWVFSAAFCFARGVGDYTLWLWLTDALAGIGFDGLYGGKRLLFGAFSGHTCIRRIRIIESGAESAAFGARLSYKLAPCAGAL